MSDRIEGKSPLSNEAGRIIQNNSIFKEGSVSLRFRKVMIAPSGEIQRVEITKDGAVVGLTAPQALTLAREIVRRLG